VETVLFVGIQASGKTTFYRERMLNTHIRINLDMLKTRRRERIILRACIEAKQRFVVDNTNSTIEERKMYILPARAAGFRIIGFYFSCAIRTALLRNAQRPDSEHIPEVGIRGTRNRLEPPSLVEGFDELFHVRPGLGESFLVEGWKNDV
jgi:predicted kinase